ncbi:MAG: hypothetical protein Kapaf2KO_02850 [Candidatus Kapaibacteriales bacterium]
MKILFTILLFAVIASPLFSLEYHVKTGKENLVKFISDAPIEDFEGITSKIDGYIASEDNYFGGAEIYLEVDLNSVETGIGLRDRHMREDYLMTEDHPFAKFSGKITKATALEDGSFKVIADGEVDIKGKKKAKKIEGIISGKGDNINVKTDFTVLLSDHDIERPSLMMAKIADEIVLKLNFNMKKVD